MSNININSPIGKSDHAVILFDYECYSERTNFKEKILYNKADYSEIRKYLKQLNWNKLMEDCDSDVNKQWSVFMNIMNDITSRYIPSKIICNQNRKGTVPLDSATLAKIKKKHKLWKKFNVPKAGEVYNEYCKVRNSVKRSVNKARREYEKDIAKQIKNNLKINWQYIKNKSKTKVGVADLVINPDDKNSAKTSNETEKAEVLSKFFSSVFVCEPKDEIPSIETRTLLKSMPELLISRDEIIKLLQKLDISKSSGPDNLHPMFLKELALELSEPLCTIFNASIMTNTIPNDWKKGHISALFKKGQRCLASNYRPVSLTSIICKTIEKLVRQHIIDHMKINKLFSKKQYGFISGRSTSLQLLNVIDKWTEALDQGLYIDCIYMDFMKAFDRVPHERLLSKMKAYGISNGILCWVRDFLSDRIQKVIVNGSSSNWSEVTSGIPQGSVLGPLLFVIYINDLPDVVNSEAFLFADDTKLFRVIENNTDIEILQEDLTNLQEWSDLWLLKFHPDKCKVIRYGNSSFVPRYMMMNNSNEHILECADKEKDIGVIFDASLQFEIHMKEKISKASSIFALIRRSYKYLNITTFKLLFKSLVRSHLEYASSVWSPWKIKYIDSIENVQRRATKQIPGFKNLSYEERLRRLKLPSLKFRRIRGDMIETYKILCNIYDPDVSPNLKL